MEAITYNDRKIKRNRVILAAATISFWAAQYVYVPFLTPHLMGMGISATLVGIIIGAYGFTQLALRIPVGICADIYKVHKRFIIVGCILAGVSSLGLMLSFSPILLIVANAVSGMASSTWISFTVMYSGFYPPDKTYKAIGIMNGCCNGGIFASYIIGGIVANSFGIEPLFVISFFMGMIGVLLASFIRSPMIIREPVRIKSLISVAKSKVLLFFAVIASIGQFTMFATANSFVPGYARSIGADELLLAASSAVFTGFSIIGSLFSGSSLYKRIGLRNVLTGALVIIALYAFLIPYCPNMYVLLILQAVGGFSNASMFSSLMSNAISGIEQDKKSSAMGFFQAIYSVGMTIGPVIMGKLVDTFVYRGAFLIISLVSLVTAVLVLVMMGRIKALNEPS